jgi:hypothetical protein
MSTVARKPTEKLIPAIDIFRERCEARAILVEACLFDLQDAVDGLQADAERTGLVDELGQDAVQKMLANAFAIVPWAGQLEADFKAIADCLETMPKRRTGPARSTIMAAEYLVRQNDSARLKAWLALHTAAERSAIRRHFEWRK